MWCPVKFSVFLSVGLYVLCISYVIAEKKSTKQKITTNNDVEINPFNVIEEGCPIVMERNALNITKLEGTWTMPYASLNWLADIGMALYNQSVKMSQITSICPRITLSHSKHGSNSSGTKSASKAVNNATYTFTWKCPRLQKEFEQRCWLQSNSPASKFICWNNRENRDLYLMIGATDHANWIVLVRCSPGEPGRPTEGMSWAILSKEHPMVSDVSDVLFGLLEGYGFDVEEFKTPLTYSNCTVI